LKLVYEIIAQSEVGYLMNKFFCGMRSPLTSFWCETEEGQIKTRVC
jgi:hypothetical protein